MLNRVVFLTTLLLIASCSDLESNKSVPTDESSLINSNYNSVTPKFLLVGRDNNILGNKFFPDNCELIVFSFKNSSGRDIPSTQQTVVSIYDTDEAYSYPFDPVYQDKESFSTKDDCESNLNGQISFNIPSATTEFIRWIKIPEIQNPSSNWYTNRAFKILTDNSNLLVGHLVVSSFSYGYFPIINPLEGGYKILGPSKIIQGICYKYLVSYFDFNGLARPLTERPYGFSNTTETKVFSDSLCSDDITKSSGLVLDQFYIKNYAAPGKSRYTPTVQAKPHSWSYVISYMETFVFPSGSSSKIELLGPNIVHSSSCAGPFMITTANQYGASLKRSSSINIDFTSSTIELFSNKDCSSSIGTSGSILIPAQDTGSVVYLQVANTPSIQTVNFSSNSISGSKKIYLDD